MANEKPIKIEVFDALFKKTQPFVAFYAVKEMACPFPPIPASKLKVVVELDDLKRKTVDADEPNKKRRRNHGHGVVYVCKTHQI